jgi:hypothetical protein
LSLEINLPQNSFQNISPGVVKTEIGVAAGIPKEMVDLGYTLQPFMESIDVANALLYALAAPPHVQVKRTKHARGTALIRKFDVDRCTRLRCIPRAKNFERETRTMKPDQLTSN